MLFIFILTILVNNHYFINDFLALSWYYIIFKFVFLNIILTYVTFRLILVKNYYELLGYTFFWIFILSIILFLYQFDVFSCLLLLSEFIILTFVLFNLININSTNLKKKNLFNSFNVILFIIIILFFNINHYNSNYFNFYIVWYKSIIFNYNDFLQLYLCLYIFNPFILLIIGLFLLFITIYLLCLFFLTQSFSKKFFIDYVKKDQSFWDQIKKKNFIKFF